MATLAPPAPAITAFPTAAVEACLRDELVETIRSLAKIKGILLPSAPSQMAATSLQIDSLVCVEILCAVEPIVGIELPEKVVKAGGYRSIDAAIKNLIPCIEAEWKKQKGLKP
jgi:acyl carrier protein